MDAEKKSAHFRQISTYKPQLLVLSSIQEHPSSKISDKPTIKASVADVDSEIGVFDAEKYFSMKLDHVNSTVDITKQHEKENKEDHPHPHPHPHPQLTKTTSSRSRTSRHGTPSVRSESSYNSQTFLMRTNNNNDNKQRKTNEISVSFGGFRCNGPCSGVKTVNTDRKISCKGRNSDRDFVSYDARKHIDKPRLRFEAKKRDYPEPEMIPVPIQRSDIAMNLERKLSMLTWDAIPNHLSTKNNNQNNGNNSSMSSKTQEEETASEASSDLFEIENITSSVYEPSEASIGWSVVTGSMADQSVISEFDMMKRATRSGSVVKTKPAVAEKVRSGGFLSGCNSHKAVSVVNSTTKNVKEAAKVDHQEMSHQKKFKTEIRIQDLSFL
ncbi:hypothetical protein EUTSA_v10007914mg [Eutrema salsugineum]|uniref:Protein PHYTOCHROME KINASE SUBSTRATE 3 n=1 Tax=Eutrema salsugineum TaxID=72664 RepID=V4MSY3_EUTSA|nr:protein PHYTOCHROME KINASE SUBSTRATE 3 [Eutrema salsugineum]ESQ34916.1 hypothetical protein EUTSA_v10007914mg [Eutrema salsugineum]